MTPVNLEGQVAFVSGAGSGIGLATVSRLLQAGCRVVANVHRLDNRCAGLYATLASDYADSILTIEGSVGDGSVVDASAKLIFQTFKRLDIIVNNAGVMLDAPIGMITDHDVQLMMNTNLVSLINVTQTLSRIMRRNKSGSIINLSSIVGRVGSASQMAYSATKAGVIGATLSASKELAPHGIRVNAVAPGLIETAMTAGLGAEARARVTAQIACGRTGTPDEVADVILFLASDLSRYVTGQVIGVDGGLVL